MIKADPLREKWVARKDHYDTDDYVGEPEDVCFSLGSF